MNANSFLSEEEVQYLKWVSIYSDIRTQETKEQLNWYLQLARKYSHKTASEEELLQFNRLREIDNFVKIITEDERPEDVEDVVKRYEEGYYDDMQKDLFSQMVIQQNFDTIEDMFSIEEIKKHLIEVEGQDINEPFIQDLIKQIFSEYKEDQKYERMFRLIQNINFKYLSNNDKYMICFIIYKELNHPLNRYIKRTVREMDKTLLAYLINKLQMRFTLTDNNPNNKKI